jgi:DnaD/phage-associated family protein
MSFIIENHTNYYLDDTQVPNLFIAEYMPGMPGDYVKVYLFAYMRAARGDVTSNELIAGSLGLAIENVLAAWTWIESKGLIKKKFIDSRDNLHYDVIFTDLKGRLFGSRSDGDESHESDAQLLRSALDEEAVRDLFRDIERISGRTLSGTDFRHVRDMLETDASPELISFAFRYCAERRRNTRLPYVAEVLRRWLEAGVSAPKDAEEHLLDVDARMDQYKQIMGALGLQFASITDAERRVFDVWLDEKGFSLADVLSAAEKAAGKRNKYDYVKKILDNEYENMISGGLGSVNGGAGAAGAPGRGVATKRERYYMEARARAEAKAEKNKFEVYARLPGVERIDRDIARLNKDSVSAIMSRSDGGRKESARIAMEIEKKLAEKAEALASAGYPADFMEIHYSCAHCRDTGVRDDGGACSCFAP